MKKTFPPTLATCLTGLSLALLAGCNATMPAVASAQSQPLVSFTSATSTAQGGAVDAFSYSEKAGDATLGNVTFADGVTRVTGKLGGEKGSTWGGIGLIAGTAAGDKTIDISGKANLRIRLASATATTLRVRLMGADATTRGNGCYPVAVQKVTAEVTSYTIPLSAFAPEGYCGSMGRSIGTVSAALASVEVTDPTVPAKTRPVDFSVGSVELLP